MSLESTKKRLLQQTSPESYTANSPKKSFTGENCSLGALANSSNMADVFSWTVFDQKLNSALDAKLQDVAKKEDLASLQAKMQELSSENAQLKETVQRLQNRLEQVDRSSRRGRLLIRGLYSKEVKSAIDEFVKLCSNNLKLTVGVTDIMKLPAGNGFVVALESSYQYYAVLSARKLLKGSTIYIEKDFTLEERDKRYNLRQASKKLLPVEKEVKVRLGDFVLYVNDKPFSWMGGKMMASNVADAQFLKQLFVKCHYNCEVAVKDWNNSGSGSAPIPSSSSSISNI